MPLEFSGGIFYFACIIMKQFIVSFFYHSSVEKRGILILLILIVLSLTLSAFIMPYLIPSPTSLKTDKNLSLAWNRFKALHNPPGNTIHSGKNFENVLFTFDPNTLDSIGFITLGLKPRTAKLLLNWRRKGKVFYKKEEFKKLYTLTTEEYNRLAPYIIIQQDTKEHNTNNSEHSKTFAPLPAHIDINTADSATLVKLRGIGPFFAHKLIERRNALGGYINQEQLMEAYHFKDSTFAMLKEKLVINPYSIHKIRLNTATEEQLKAHPYIGEKGAKNILLYRNAIERFEKIDQLRQVPLMNEEIYRKIVPYLSIE